MPALPRPRHALTVPLPPRQALVAATTDVLVVGGGPAGIGAALGATEAGAEVVLAERYGFLGGNATAALVMPLMSFHTQRPAFEQPGATKLFPTDHGPGEPVVAGALARLLHRLVRDGGAIAPSLDTGYTVPFDPEQFKLTALELLDEAGVQFLFHAFASDVLRDGPLQGVVFETKSGPVVVRARAIVDCTGDGDVAARAGARYEIGRDEDGLVQPMTLMFRLVEFEAAAFEAYVRAHPDQWRGVHGLWDLIRQASEAGELDLPREDILFFGTPHEGEVSVNSTRVMRLLGTDVFDWSRAELESRRQMRQIAAFLRRYVPGFERAYVTQSGVHTGVRETRRTSATTSSRPRTCSRGASSMTWSPAGPIPSTFTTPRAAARC
jgi:glycine/D-amino acid oxidase-like deaminating enzyme